MRPVYVLLSLLFLLSSCAGIDFTPSGGPKDTQPPQVVSTMPQTGSTMVSTREVRIAFDEYIQVAASDDDLLISPPPPVAPTVKVRLKELRLVWDEVLPPNTTYQIRLDDYVKDFTESNPVKDLLLVFSTGPVIDSARIVADLAPQGLDPMPEELTALLFDARIDIDTLFDARPIYRSPVDAGMLQFDFVKPGSYHLAVIHDANGNGRPDGSTDWAGIHPGPIDLDSTLRLNDVIIAPLDPPRPVVEVETRWDHLLLRSDRALTDLEMIRPAVGPGAMVPSPHHDSIHVRLRNVASIDTVILRNQGRMDTISTTPASGLPTWTLAEEWTIAPDEDLVLPLPDRPTSFDAERIVALSPERDTLDLNAHIPGDLPARLVLTFLDSLIADTAHYVVRLADSALLAPSGASPALRTMFHVEHSAPTSSIVLRSETPLPPDAHLILFNANDRFLLSGSVFSGMVLDNVPKGSYKLLIFNDLNSDSRWNGVQYPPYRPAEPVLLAVPDLAVQSNWQHELVIP